MNKQQHETSALKRHRNTAALAAFGLFLVAVIGFGFIGFGGGSGNDMNGMHMGAGPASNGAPVATNAVSISGFAFSPATITVPAGTTVVWTNDDSVAHDVTFQRGGFRSGVLNHGDTFSHTFTSAGTYAYLCSIHPFMHGTVVVTTSGSTNANATRHEQTAVPGY